MSGLKMTGWGVTEFVWEGSEACFGKVRREGGSRHTPSIAFQHLPPNSARFSYATEGALFYLRTAVHRRGQRPPGKRFGY